MGHYSPPGFADPDTRNLALLTKKMETELLDAIVAVKKKNVIYLSNAPTAWSWQQNRADGPRLCLAVWPLEGEPVLIVGELEREATMEHCWFSRIECYRDYAQTPYEKLTQVLDDMGLRGKRIGIEIGGVGATYWKMLTNAHPESTFIDAGPLLDEVRAQKTAVEIDLAKQACALLDRAFVSVFSSARPGVTEIDLHAAMCETLTAMGAGEAGGTLLAGERAMVIHRPSARYPIAPGDIIRTDYYASFSGRWANLSRVFVVGEPLLEQRRMYRQLREIELAIMDHITPGIRAYELFQFYVREVQRRGFEAELPLLGHNIGIDVHEEPMIVQVETGTLEPNMVICIEPLIRRQYHIQDQLLITADGVRLLSDGIDTSEMFVID